MLYQRRLFLLVLSIIVLGVGVTVAGCGDDTDDADSVPSNAVATVNGHVIPMRVLKAQERQAVAFVRKNPKTKDLVTQDKLLGNLIKYEWQRQEAVRLGVHFPPGKLSVEERRTYAYEGLGRKILKRKVTVTEQEVRDYWARHREAFVQPAERQIKILQADSEAAASRAATDLRAGATWKAVLAHDSVPLEPRVLNDGRGNAVVSPGQLPDPVDRAVFTAPKHVVTGPVQTENGWFVVEVVKIAPERRGTLARARKAITSGVLRRKATHNFERFIANLGSQYRDKTVCADGYLVEECRNGPEPGADAQ